MAAGTSRRWRTLAIAGAVAASLAIGAASGAASGLLEAVVEDGDARAGAQTAASSSSAAASASGQESERLQEATLERVVDGDTIIVELDGERERVRLVGINSAESVAPEEWRNTEEGKQDSDHLKAELSEGQVLWLERDTSDRDKYDRLLRYVWLELPSDPDSEDEVREKMLNAQLVAGGWAEAKRYPPDTRWADLFEQIAAERG